jgi:hypothetical protein
MRRRGRAALAAGIPVARATSWGPLVGGSVTALGLVIWLRVRDAGTAGLIGGLRLGAVLLAAGAAFALDDPAATTLASSPTPLSARRLLRLALAVGACVAAWTAMLRIAGGPARLAGAGLSVEAAGMLALALAAASVAAHWVPNGLGGLAGGPTLVSFLLAAMVVQQYWPQWGLLAFPGTPAWEAAQVRWLVVAGAGGTLVALAGLDPAGRPTIVRRR